MICQSCLKNDASVHKVEVTYDLAGKPSIRQVHLCPLCAKANGITLAQPPSFPNMVQILGKAFLQPFQSGNLSSPNLEPGTEDACPECGWTKRDFRQTSRFGCPHDYEYFTEFVDEVLEKIHGDSKHKRPEQENRLEILRKELDAAVLAEDYETAARLRDAIRDFESSLEKPEGLV
jgi:protein arginine kinase activator